MNLQNTFEQYYKNHAHLSVAEMGQEATTYSKGLFHYVVESKNRFLPDLDWTKIRVLEVGAGRGGVGLLLARLGADITLMDFSSTAMGQAQSIFRAEGLEVTTLVGDVTHPDLALPHKFDLIIDSHLLHCLTTDPDRASYYRLVHDYLNSSGIFIVETMAHRKKLFIPDGFMFDEKNVLWQMFGDWTPVRKILDSLDLEDEVKRAEFEIIYFYYYGQYGFIPHKTFMEIPAEVLPAAVRMVTKKRQV